MSHTHMCLTKINKYKEKNNITHAQSLENIGKFHSKRQGVSMLVFFFDCSKLIKQK